MDDNGDRVIEQLSASRYKGSRLNGGQCYVGCHVKDQWYRYAHVPEIFAAIIVAIPAVDASAELKSKSLRHVIKFAIPGVRHFVIVARVTTAPINDVLSKQSVDAERGGLRDVHAR